MAQRLDEGPLSLDLLVEQLRGHPASPLDGPPPQPLEDVPRFAEPAGIGRPHLHPVRVAAVELRLHQGHHIDAVDPQVLDLAADVHVHQGCATDHDPRQIGQVEARVGEVHVVEPGAAQVNVLEPGPGQALPGEVGHPASLPRNAHIHRPPGCTRGLATTLPKGVVAWTVPEEEVQRFLGHPAGMRATDVCEALGWPVRGESSSSA